MFLDSWTEKPAFGTGLDEHLKRSGREVALPIEACVMMLLETGMKEEVRRLRQRGGERLDWNSTRKPALFVASYMIILLCGLKDGGIDLLYV